MTPRKPERQRTKTRREIRLEEKELLRICPAVKAERKPSPGASALAVVKKLKEPPFRWSDISEKQFLAMSWWRSAGDRFDGIIGDGSIRSGKTISFAFGFVDWAMNSFDNELFALCGKTIGSLRMNVVEPLKRILRARGGYTVKEAYSRNLLIIRWRDKINTFELFGGKDEASADTIQGRTLAGIFFDEVPLMPESFVQQALARCSVKGSKFWFCSNPEHPRHWFKIKFINDAKAKRLLYLHFTMDDNLSLNAKIRRRYEALYVGTFRLRYVKGLWVAAEGVVYDMYSGTGNELDTWEKRGAAVEERFVSIDYGTANPFAALDIAIRAGVYCVEHEIYFSSREKGFQKTDSEYRADLESFYKKHGYDKKAVRLVVDPSATSFIAEVTKAGFVVTKADNEVLDGIKAVQTGLAEGRIRISRTGCPRLLDEIGSYRWSPKASASGHDAPMKVDDHAADALRYGVFTRESRFKNQIRAVTRPAV
jgi:PBSX family phage terminase large subunit